MLLSPIFSIIFAICVRKTWTYESCEGNFCPPLKTNPKTIRIQTSAVAPVLLGRDTDSGCICREFPEIFVVCFGRNVCQRMPLELNITTPLLKLTNTNIVELAPGDFGGVDQLEALQIEGNYNLSRILPGTFFNLTNLSNVSISFNPNLKALYPLTFEGLVNLRSLFLIKNGFQNVYDVTQALSQNILPKLYILSLNENNFVTISKNDFDPMLNSTLEDLNLVLCRLEYLHPECFSPLRKLAVLRLGENSFNTSTVTDLIEKTIESGIPLKTLNLYYVGFRKAPPRKLMEVLSKSNVSKLILARNQFEVISSDFFPFMPNLRILDLRDVLALEIHNDAFKNLPNLKTLLLSENKLTTIPEGALLENLTYLDLQQNSGNSLYNYQSYFSVTNGIFSNMKQLVYLNLNFNRLNFLSNTSFTGLINLRILGLKNSTLYHIAENTFAPLKTLVFLNLENNYFIVNNEPPGIDEGTFKGLDNLQVLLLGGCGITKFSKTGNPLVHLKSLEHLGLQRNRLTTISPEDFSPLVNLQSIDMSDNMLIAWESMIFRENRQLKIVLLNRNKISLFTTAMLEDFANVTELELEQNPFSCDCRSFSMFFEWFVHSPESVKVEGRCAFPDFLSNLTIVEYFEKVHNGSLSCFMEEFPNKLVVILPLVLLLLFFITLAIFVYYYRWHLRYWIFLTRLYLSRKGKIKPSTEKAAYTNYIYDAFVSYSNEDRNFVVRLVSMLENYEPFLKLCVYERDFQIGTIISENVLESVAQSRRTLLIISDNYAKSQWCRWESQIAEHHRLFFENKAGEYVDDSLVLIKLGPVSDNHLTPTLKYLLKTRIYLQWEPDEKKQKVFWDKLRSALSPPKHEQIILECTHI